MKTPVIIGVAATVVALLGMITYLVATNHDPTPFVIAAAAIIPGIAALFGLNQVANAVNKVDQQTNGTLSSLRLENSQLRVENATLRTATPTDIARQVAVTPAPAPVSDPLTPDTATS